jgi:hypothetical protein
LAQDVVCYVNSCSVVPKPNLLDMLQQGKSFPYLSGLVLICPLISSLISPLLMVTLLLWLFWTDSQNVVFIPLSGLPTALQVAEALFQQVFLHYGFPEDIVSDHGPQLTS